MVKMEAYKMQALRDATPDTWTLILTKQEVQCV